MTERGIRLLLVDDDELVLRDYGRLLRANGFTVDTAPDGPSGLERLTDTSYDVIVYFSMLDSFPDARTANVYTTNSGSLKYFVRGINSQYTAWTQGTSTFAADNTTTNHTPSNYVLFTDLSGTTDTITFDPTVFSVFSQTDIHTVDGFPALSTGADVVAGGGAVRIVCDTLAAVPFFITSSGNAISGFEIDGCNIAILIRNDADDNVVGGVGTGQANVLVNNGIGISIHNLSASPDRNRARLDPPPCSRRRLLSRGA